MTQYATMTTQIPGPVNVVYQRQFLEEAYPWCPYFEGSKPATIGESMGSFTAKWRRINNLNPSTTALSEVANATNITFPIRQTITPTVTDVTATVQKYGQTLIITEEVDLVNYNGYTGELNRALAVAAGRSLNQLQRDELEDNLSAVYASGVNGAANIANAISYSDIVGTVNWLARNNGLPFTDRTGGSGNENTSPIPPCYLGFAHVDVEEDIRALPGFQAAESYMSQTSLYRQEFGRVGRVRFLSSTEGSVDTNTGVAVGTTGLRATGTKVDAYNTVIVAQNAHGSLGLDRAHPSEVFQAGKGSLPSVELLSSPRQVSVVDTLAELATMSYKTWHAAKIISKLDSNNVTMWGRCIRSGATNISV